MCNISLLHLFIALLKTEEMTLEEYTHASVHVLYVGPELTYGLSQTTHCGFALASSYKMIVVRIVGVRGKGWGFLGKAVVG
jgi:hypothetical protein